MSIRTASHVSPLPPATSATPVTDTPPPKDKGQTFSRSPGAVGYQQLNQPSSVSPTAQAVLTHFERSGGGSMAFRWDNGMTGRIDPMIGAYIDWPRDLQSGDNKRRIYIHINGSGRLSSHPKVSNDQMEVFLAQVLAQAQQHYPLRPSASV